MEMAGSLRKKYKGNHVSIHLLTNARSGNCSQNCAYCAQSCRSKAEIEKIRGVKCDHAINKLMDYDLVRELGRLDAPGRPILLGTTEEFLRCFGVQGLDELPEMDPVQLEDFKAEAEEEIQMKLDV